MFGRSSMFPSMLDDPFFRDPLAQMQQMMMGDPFMNGMFVPSLLPPQMNIAAPPQRPCNQTLIEEVDCEEKEERDGSEPIVEEPDEPTYHRHYRSRPSQLTQSYPANQLSVFEAPVGGFSMTTGTMGNGGGMFVTSSSFTSVSGPGGVTYQSSSQMRMGPGGVMEAKKVVKDGRSGTEAVAVARGLGEQRRTVVRSRDRCGEEQRQDILYQIRPEEADQFDKRWMEVAETNLPGWKQQGVPRLTTGSNGRVQQPLALPAASGSSGQANARVVNRQYQGAYGGAYSTMQQSQPAYGSQYPTQYSNQYYGKQY